MEIPVVEYKKQANEIDITELLYKQQPDNKENKEKKES